MAAFVPKLASDFSRRMREACLAQPRLVERAPWWDSLDPDFARRPDPFELRLLDKIPVELTAASDVALRTAGACLVGSLALPLGYHPLAIRRLLVEAEHYGALAEQGDVDRFYVRPPRGVRIERRRAFRPLFRPDDGECEDLRFESPFVPTLPSARKGYLSHEKNRIAHARHWRHATGPRSTVLAIHGFSADLTHFNEWFFAIPWLYRSGYDVLLVTLPFHGPRQTRLSPFSGHGFFAGGAGRINEALAQAVCDLRVLVDDLFERGVPQVGVTGMSLGGLTCSLLAAAEGRLAFAIPNVPVVSLPDLVLEWEPIGTVVRSALRAVGRDVRFARRLLGPASPLTWQPRVARERRMIIGGLGDRLAPPRQSRLLWDHWERCRIHWFPGSHVLHLDRGAYFREMREFLGEVGFRPRT